jgi:Tfp pilus assembly pilus retraction ATPase PilT
LELKDLQDSEQTVFIQRALLLQYLDRFLRQVPDFDSLGLPKVLLDMTDVSNGMMLVTGPTGSGKSTTLASIIDRLNKMSLDILLHLRIL